MLSGQRAGYLSMDLEERDGKISEIKIFKKSGT